MNKVERKVERGSGEVEVGSVTCQATWVFSYDQVYLWVLNRFVEGMKDNLEWQLVLPNEVFPQLPKLDGMTPTRIRVGDHPAFNLAYCRHKSTQLGKLFLGFSNRPGF